MSKQLIFDVVNKFYSHKKSNEKPVYDIVALKILDITGRTVQVEITATQGRNILKSTETLLVLDTITVPIKPDQAVIKKVLKELR